MQFILRAALLPDQPLHTHIIIIIIITRFPCLEARCVCRQAAEKATKILPLVGLARSKQDPINGGHGAQYLYRPPPAGANIHTHMHACIGTAEYYFGSHTLVLGTQQREINSLHVTKATQC
jgi:hypothetical protein